MPQKNATEKSDQNISSKKSDELSPILSFCDVTPEGTNEILFNIFVIISVHASFGERFSHKL